MKTFRNLALVSLLVGIPGGLRAQQDPLAADAGKPKELVNSTTIKVVYEVFSLPMKQAAAIQRSGLSDTVFYEKMLVGLKDKSVTQESFLVVRADPGQTVTGQQIQEYIYPTEYAPAELPNMVANVERADGGKKAESGIFPVTPATAFAYDTKNLGESLEVEAVFGADGKTIQLRIAPSRVSLIGRLTTGQGVSELEMPYFASPSLKTAILAKSGKPCYLGTVSAPPVLQLEGKEEQVFFAFVTATHVSQ